jgi:hypothetical protein
MTESPANIEGASTDPSNVPRNAGCLNRSIDLPGKGIWRTSKSSPLAIIERIMTDARDDFSQPMLRLLAQCAGYICAYPW